MSSVQQPSSSTSFMSQTRRGRSARLPSKYNKDAEASAMGEGYPTEYQHLVPPPAASATAPVPTATSTSAAVGVGYGSTMDRTRYLAADAAATMHLESTSSVGALTLDDIERSFNNVVSQQYPRHHRAASASDLPPPPPPPAPPTHDSLLSGRSRGPSPKQQHHRRVGSTGGLLNLLPPKGKSPGGSMQGRKRVDSAASTNRARSFSGSGLGGTAAAASMVARGHHRSISRTSSVTDFSVASLASMISVVSDISRSAFFRGVTQSGQVQMNYPTEHVRIIMQRNLPRGHVFCHPTDVAVYEAYHQAAEEIQQAQWENIEDEEENLVLYGGYASSNAVAAIQSSNNPLKSLQCRCQCSNCAGCTGKAQLLPPQNFVINVPNDIYRRLLDEISESQTMPCGLYFCGHHEDVSNPSIWIAAGTILGLLTLMGGVAYYTAT